MIEFGKTLREAREAKGYSVSQLAEMTHILPQIIENLEREDFSKIVAPIYGRGFVKLYCEQVGIDAKPLVAEFMEIYNGNRPPVIRMRATESEVEEEGQGQGEVQGQGEGPDEGEGQVEDEAPPQEVAPAPEPMQVDSEAKDEPPPVTTDWFSKPTLKAEPFKPEPGDLPFSDEQHPKRDYRLPGYSMPEVPRSFWRFGVLIAAAIAVLLLIFFGCRTLYRMTMGTGEMVENVESVEKVEKTPKQPETRNPKPETRNARPAAPRKGVKVPPLYID